MVVVLRSREEAIIAPAPHPGPEAAKDSLRQTASQSRRGLSAAERQRASRAAVGRLRDLAVVAEATVVLLYAATEGELDPADLLTDMRGRGARTLLPRVRGTELELVAASNVSRLVAGYGGISEPVGPAVDPSVVELALVPGVAFDPRGGRLGRGGGHYDRLLARLPDTAVTVGLCFSCQVVPRVPQEPHDQPVDMVVTEHAVHRVATGS